MRGNGDVKPHWGLHHMNTEFLERRADQLGEQELALWHEMDFAMHAAGDIPEAMLARWERLMGQWYAIMDAIDLLQGYSPTPKFKFSRAA